MVDMIITSNAVLQQRAKQTHRDFSIMMVAFVLSGVFAILGAHYDDVYLLMAGGAGLFVTGTGMLAMIASASNY